MLNQLATWVISGGGAGILAFYLLERWPWFGTLQSEIKRWVAWVVTGVIADLAYLGCLLILSQPMPGPDWRAWVIALADIAGAAILVNQGTHARLVLSKQTKEAA
jgi:hypothetical protein